MMFVTVDDEISVLFEQHVPEAGHPEVTGVPARADPRTMPDGDRALFRVGFELLLQPVILGAASFNRESRVHDDLAVEHDHFPFAEIVAVVALALLSGRLAKRFVVGLAETV